VSSKVSARTAEAGASKAVPEAQTIEIRVTNLAEAVSEAELRDYFTRYGDVASAVILSHEDGTSTCIGFLEMERQAGLKAIHELHGVTHRERRLRLEEV
jgi:RNA recognition motif-containing protein